MNISIGRKFIFIPLILSLLVFCGYRWYLHSILLPLRKNCGNKLVLNYFGMVLYERGYEEKSVKLWERALEIDPNFVPALNNIATYYSHNGRALESIKLERRTIQLDPNNAVYHYNLSTFYFVYRYITAREFGWDLEKVYNKALEEMKIARDLDPLNERYALEYAQSFFAARLFRAEPDWEEAVKASEYCLRLPLNSTQESIVYMNLGRIYMKLGDFERAEEYLYRAKEIHPTPAVERLLVKCRK